ncbi:MAG: SDR family oxidoreductase [Dechloromonas sp.]|uniref:SDR family NAD(P)-dependent oxidoreductase n=1 Tax=Azonexus hydrophilus TaxID=418702 RepID=UPI000419AB0F|nr:SDR family NAD(P)-dependent oxidoreductase [Azonexus hydrophilus]MCA1939061.1 SDR family oxidoreductase [Dechloromonas sp.]
MLLKDKLAIITGCNRGIGLATLNAFVAQGASIIACVRAETADFAQHCAQLAATHGVAIEIVSFDLTSTDATKEAVASIVGMRRQIDILVNNAGAASGALFQMTTQRDLRQIFEINFFAQLQFTQSISRLMARQRSGSIINLASVAGLIGEPGMTAYGASKAALIQATRTMASELGASGIRVNAIAPSITHTDMYDQMDPLARNRLIEASALKRAAEPDEIANVALFLASDLSSYITGQVIRVDGGIL